MATKFYWVMFKTFAGIPYTNELCRSWDDAVARAKFMDWEIVQFCGYSISLA